jgi:hypothetical protein
MTADHVDGLALVGLEPELWRWIPHQVATREEMRAYVNLALEEFHRGVTLPFVTIANATIWSSGAPATPTSTCQIADWRSAGPGSRRPINAPA